MVGAAPDCDFTALVEKEIGQLAPFDLEVELDDMLYYEGK